MKELFDLINLVILCVGVSYWYHKKQTFFNTLVTVFIASVLLIAIIRIAVAK